MYEPRIYRDEMKSEHLFSFTVVEGESDCWVSAKSKLENETRDLLKYYRKQIIEYGEKNPQFITSLVPLAVDDNAPEIIQHMLRAGQLAHVGPMAAVAGAISEYIGKDLLSLSEEIMIENGGDIFIQVKQPKQVKIYAGNSPFSNNLSIGISPEQTPIGICTSAGTVGHSISFGKADAVVVLSKDTLFADAFATRIGNMIKSPEDIQAGLDFGKNQVEILGIVIIIGNQMGIWGEVELSQ